MQAFSQVFPGDTPRFHQLEVSVSVTVSLSSRGTAQTAPTGVRCSSRSLHRQKLRPSEPCPLWTRTQEQERLGLHACDDCSPPSDKTKPPLIAAPRRTAQGSTPCGRACRGPKHAFGQCASRSHRMHTDTREPFVCYTTIHGAVSVAWGVPRWAAKLPAPPF